MDEQDHGVTAGSHELPLDVYPGGHLHTAIEADHIPAALAH
jgi:hypothetical protein